MNNKQKFGTALGTLLMVGALNYGQAATVTGGPGAGAGAATGAAGKDCGPATGGDPAKTCSGASNPINVITGNKYQREVDMPALPGVLGLELVRHYNSSYSTPGNVNGILGRGWKLSYEIELEARGNSVQVMQPDGERIIFSRSPLDRNLCSTLDPRQGSITVAHTDRGDEYLWQLPSGRLLRFNHLGKLTQIRVPSGEFVSLQHDRQGHLVKVTDPQGRSLELSYLPTQERSADAAHPRFSGVQHIDTPTGRFSYEYGSPLPTGSSATALSVAANLVQVVQPAGANGRAIKRQYLYEDARHPTLLTGIALRDAGADGKPTAQRIATYAYDERGWAVRSEHGSAIDLLELDRASPLLNSKPGHVVLVHSKDAQHPQGQALEVMSAQVADGYRIIETRGVACPSTMNCPAGNVRYTYDELGHTRSVTRFAAPAVSRTDKGWQIAALSQPLSADKYDYDGLGRVIRHTEVRFGASAGKAAVASERIVEEFRYDGASDRVTLVRQPSVVRGQWHEVQTTYNDLGQLTQRIERGWAPALADRPAQPIERRVNYRYARINGRSLLVAIDGPLAGEADATRFEWDARGDYVVRTITPDGVANKVLARDAAGRVQRLAQDDGSRYSETFFSFEQGQLATRTRAAWLRRDGRLDAASRQTETSSYTYDPQQRLVAITRPDGTQVRTEFGADDKPSKLILPDGGQVTLTRNAAGMVVAASRLDGEQHVLQTVRFEQDGQQRLTGLADDLGQIVTLRYDASAQRPTEVEHPGAVKTTYAYDELGFITEQLRAAGTDAQQRTRWSHDATGNVTAIDRGTKQFAAYDDFGRKLAQADQHHGVMLYVWDAADRLIAQINESKKVQRFEYDAAGRLIATGVDKQTALSRTRYDGTLPSETSAGDSPAAPAGERQQWRYDSLGRLIEERHWLPKAAEADKPAGALLFVTTLRYDERGRLVERTLVDAQQRAHRMSYAWDDATGHLLGIAYNGERVVSDLHASWLGGISSFTHGNGVSERFERDARGRLTHHAALIAQRPVLDDRYTYDGNNRLVAANEATGTQALARRYGYDAIGRLVSEQRDGSAADTYAYDQQGNRIRSTVAGQSQRYAYDDQRLIAVEASTSQAGWASIYGVLGQPLTRWSLQAVGQQPAGSPALGAPAVRTIYGATGKALAAVDAQNRMQARYGWGQQGERISKTLVAGAQTHTTYYLYQNSHTSPTVADARDQGLQLQAEADDAGQVRRQYVYLDGQVVASIDTQAANGTWERLRTHVWAWFGKVPDAQGQIYAVHPDQRHAPVAVSNAQGQVVWRAQYSAFGLAQIEHPAVQRTASWSWIGEAYADAAPAFELNLRLPGQYWDAERGIHYNVQRDYEPQTGRYTTADPVSMQAGLDLGQADRLAGENVYGYVSSNPLSQIDSQGLYEEDVHYYMTFFLALVAGVDYNEARIMALAAQYIDNNPDTRPLDPDHTAESWITDIPGAMDRLEKYHFTQAGYDPARTPLELAAFLASGGTTDLASYEQRRILNPTNPQLTRLKNAANNAQNTRCAKLQFFGEYLHAFEDTFGHRDKGNGPIYVKAGLGHLAYGHEPDKTYNETVLLSRYPAAIGIWDTREARTLEMEKEVFDKMKADFKATGTKTQSWSDVQDVLTAYNAIKETGEQDGDDDKKDGGVQFKQKLELLNNALKKFGIKRPDGSAIDFLTSIADGGEGYGKSGAPDEAVNNRNQFLCTADGKRLAQADYEGTLLPDKSVPCK